MRMGYYDGFDAAKVFDCLDCLFIDIGDTIPQDVTLFRAAQYSALADGDLWLCVYTY